MVLLAVIGTLMVLMLWVINSSFRTGFEVYLIERELPAVQQAAQRLGEYYQHQGSWQNVRGSPRVWRQLLESEGMQFATPARPHRRSGPGPAPPLAARPGRSPLAAQSLPHRLTLTDVDKQRVFGNPDIARAARWLPIRVAKETVGWLALTPQSLATDQLAQHFVEQQRQNVQWLAGMGLLLVLLLSAGLARLFVRPVTRLTQATDQLARGDLEVRVPVAGRDELAQLSDNFNQMAARLQQAAQLRQQWISDISHELRTPIAVLSAEIEAMVDGVRQPTPERIGSLYSEVGGLTGLVADLHQLALSDQSALELELTTVDLLELCQGHVALFQPRMAASQLNLLLEVEPQQCLQVRGDSRRLSQLLTNLLENSLRYTDAGGTVVVQLRCEPSWLVLEVKDSTPGVPEAALEQIFERLYRVDRSRSRAMGGSGLGLSICRSLVEAQGGTIQADNRCTGGLIISIRLPLSDS